MSREPEHLLLRALRIVAWLIVAVVVLAFVLVVTVFALFIIGWFALLIPIGAFVLAGVVLTEVRREKCAICGGPLRPEVIERSDDLRDGLSRLRAVYTCEPYGHRTWRWAQEGGPLHRLYDDEADDNAHEDDGGAER